MTIAAESIFPVRRMDFNMPPFPRYYVSGNSWKTHFANAMSAIFPDGERFFMDSVRNFENRVNDPLLKRQIKAFVGQEANHGKEHEAFNQALQAQHGLPMRRLQGQIRFAVRFAQRILPKRDQLALTVAFEHFTAILAGHLLEHSEELERMDSAYREIMLWHIVEETEHKAVAFDVYKAVDGSYPRRIITMLLATTAFLSATFLLQAQLLAHDRKLTDWRAIPGQLHFLLINPGLFTRILPEYLDFYKPSFHPWQHDNSALIREQVRALAGYEIKRSA